MLKIDFQVHGSAHVFSKFFGSKSEADVWMLAHQDFLSFSHVFEVFH